MNRILPNVYNLIESCKLTDIFQVHILAHTNVHLIPMLSSFNVVWPSTERRAGGGEGVCSTPLSPELGQDVATAWMKRTYWKHKGMASETDYTASAGSALCLDRIRSLWEPTRHAVRKLSLAHVERPLKWAHVERN